MSILSNLEHVRDTVLHDSPSVEINFAHRSTFPFLLRAINVSKIRENLRDCWKFEYVRGSPEKKKTKHYENVAPETRVTFAIKDSRVRGVRWYQ